MLILVRPGYIKMFRLGEDRSGYVMLVQVISVYIMLGQVISG